jgi:DNA-binding transcriptional ArsR family regulator
MYNHMVMQMSAHRLSEEDLDRAFGALSDRTRRSILARLAEGDAGVLDVAAPFPISQPAVTKHLRVLEEAGLISRHRLARQRMCHLEPQRLKQLSEWVGSYREFWEESFERLDELLEELQAGGTSRTAFTGAPERQQRRGIGRATRDERDRKRKTQRDPKRRTRGGDT